MSLLRDSLTSLDETLATMYIHTGSICQGYESDGLFALQHKQEEITSHFVH